MKLPISLKVSLSFMTLFLVLAGAFIAKSYYNQNKLDKSNKPDTVAEEKTTISKQLLSIEGFKFKWETEYDGDKYLVISGYLINDSDQYFDQILRSFQAEVKFKNGHVKNFDDKVETVNKDNMDISNMFSYAFSSVLKSFLRNDQVLKPGEKVFFKLGHESAGKLIVLNKNELFYPIESIKFKLIAEARTPLNEVWRGDLIACEVPLQ